MTRAIRSRLRARGALFAAGALVAAPVTVFAAAGSAAADSDVLFTIEDDRITESSGLVASALHPDVYWTHNDSGDKPRVFAIGKDGATKATITLAGVDARDWEAITVGKDDAGNPALFVGDIGDNHRGRWPEVWIYRFTEPTTLADATIKPTKFRVRYDDGPRDAEALLLDPRTNKLYIASKEAEGGLYEQPEQLSTTGLNTFRRIAAGGAIVTDGAFAPDGSRFVLRGYFSATVFAAPGRELGGVNVPIQRQGESVAWSRDGRELLFGSEGKRSQVRRVVLAGDNRPDSVRSAPGGTVRLGTQTGEPTAAATADKGDARFGVGKAKAYGPGLLAVAGLVVLFLLGRRVFRWRRRGKA
ncbi:hypothetical protein [Embleya sp. AB8]|uniref:hypothetical protein n=1 Tax=Embleya sp. AB8 TaxID=3156304 RepID=UPI003C7257A0